MRFRRGVLDAGESSHAHYVPAEIRVSCVASLDADTLRDYFVTIVTAQTLRSLGVPRTTAHRWVSRAVAARSWETTTVATRTRPALALVIPDDAYAALVASLAREVL